MGTSSRLVLSIAALSGLILSPWTARATTWRQVTVTCPICQTKLTGDVLVSSFIPEMSPDFRALHVGLAMALRRLTMCPKCGFTTRTARFENPQGLDKTKVRKALAGTKPPALFLKLDRAILVEENWTRYPHLLAHLALAAKWLADDTGEPNLIQERLAEAIKAHQAILRAGKAKAEAKTRITYLIGELYRQAGDRNKAVAWLAEAERLAPEPVPPLIQQQLFLARHEGKAPRQIFRIAEKGTDGEKLAAVKFVRGLDDGEVIAFLKNFCLNCPDDLRMPAIEALVGDKPREVHLPIFLAGLRSKHFRTVQYSAMAVEQLGARQAAPIIVQALRSPVEFADSALWDALAALATEKEVGFLVRQLAQQHDGFRHHVFEGLLSTGSPTAVPHILRMLKTDSSLATYWKESVFGRAAAFGPPLLSKLRDLKTAPRSDPLAVFKVRALAASKSPHTDKQLLAVLPRGDTVALYAAKALARRGSAAGKKVLLQYLDPVRADDQASIADLHPMLTPADFDVVNQRMEDQRAGLKWHTEQCRANCLKRLQDPEVTDTEKRLAKRELEHVRSEEDRFMARWVLLLAATGNPKARPICLKCLESPSTERRAAAARALAHVYDQSIGDALVKRLKSEDSEVKRQIIRTIGNAGDKRHVDAISNVAGEPTLVSTKLAWIEAMTVLAPDKARPVLQEWIKSPSEELAAAARKALAKREDKQGGPRPP